MPYEIDISVLPAPKGGEILIRKMFEPLGYSVELERHILDDKFLDWGDSKYFTLKLRSYNYFTRIIIPFVCYDSCIR